MPTINPDKPDGRDHARWSGPVLVFKSARLRLSRMIVMNAAVALGVLGVNAAGALATGGHSPARTAAPSPSATAAAGLGRAQIRVRVRAAASRSPQALVGRVASLSAGTTLAAAPGQQLRYRWSIVSRPRGSHARLLGVSQAHPRLRPDRPGRYVLEVRIGRVPAGATAARPACAGPCTNHRITVTVSIPSGPIGVPVNTIWNENGWGVQVGSPGAAGSDFYAAPDQNDALQLLVLDRGTLALVENESFANDAPGAAALNAATSKLNNRDLVIITKPNPLLTNTANDPSPAATINSALAQIGVPPIPAEVSTGTAPYSPAGACSAFSAVGVPGAPAGQSHVNPCVAGISHQGYIGGDLQGYFRQDLSEEANYEFVDDTRVPFDTGDPNADPAVVTVGSPEPGSSVLPQVYASANLSSGAGFFVVILNAGSLTLQTKQTFSDDVAGLQAMDTLLSGWGTDPDALIIVRSIGKVGPPASPGGIAWDAVAGELAQIGGSDIYFDALNGSSDSEYAQVGPGGTRGYPNALTQVATATNTGTGRLTGLLAYDNASQFYPAESYNPGALRDPSRPLAGTLPGILALPPTAWPDRNTATDQAVLSCIVAHVDPVGPLQTPIESNYTNQDLDTSWTAWASKITASGYYQTLSAYPGCGSFTHTVFDSVTAELSREWTAVSQVWSMIQSLQAPLLDSQGNAAEIASITNQVSNDLAAGSQQTQLDGLGMLSDFMWTLSGLPGLDAVSGVMNVVAGGLAVADVLDNSNSGANLPESQIPTTGAELGATLESEYTASIQGLGNIGEILVSDPTKLEDAAQNAADTTNAAADWAWTTKQAKAATDQLLVAARRTAYETLFPLSYSLFRLTPGTASWAPITSYRCAQLISTPTIVSVETWQPFSNVQPLGHFVATAPPGELEQWVFAAPDQTALTNWGSPPARVPGDDLLNSMLGPPPSGDIQTGPLFSGIQFAVEAYNDGTTDTIPVTHIEQDSNSNFCHVTTGS